MLNSKSSTQAKGFHYSKGITVIDLVIATSIVLILLALAIPSYAIYTSRSDLAMATGILSDLGQRMHESHALNDSYRINAEEPACAIGDFIDGQFTYRCTAGSDDEFTWTATTVRGSNPYLSMGYEFTVDQDGLRQTTLFKGKELSPALQEWKVK
jgi:type IV pilus assembly protein PilE